MTHASIATAETLQQVGTALDQAEADYKESLRYSVKAQQRAYRLLREAKQVYFVTARAPWLASIRKLEAAASQNDDDRLLARLLKAWDQAVKYRKNLPSTASVRQYIDAELEEARAEGMYFIVRSRWDARLDQQQEARRKANARKKRK
jgi:hypothetical protein